MGPYHMARTAAAADHFKKSGYTVVAIELCDQEETRDWKIDRLKLPFKLITLAPGCKLPDKSLAIAGMSSRLGRLLADIVPEVVVVAGYDRPEMRAALKWGEKNRKITVLMSESKFGDRPRPFWKRWILKRILSRVDAALVSGTRSLEYFVAHDMPRERIFGHYGAVDNAFFIKKSHEARLKNDRPPYIPAGNYFIASSRLIEERKNLKRMFLAYAKYRGMTKGEPWQLVVCGDGEDRHILEEFVKKNSIKGIIFSGFQQVERLAGYYAYAGCFVHAAVREPWGLVVNEAMASGLPVLVSDRCGCACDLVKQGVNGFIFDPFNVDELAGLMLKMASLSPAERAAMGDASQKIIDDWSPERFADGLWKALTSVNDRKIRF